MFLSHGINYLLVSFIYSISQNSFFLKVILPEVYHVSIFTSPYFTSCIITLICLYNLFYRNKNATGSYFFFLFWTSPLLNYRGLYEKDLSHSSQNFSSFVLKTKELWDWGPFILISELISYQTILHISHSPALLGSSTITLLTILSGFTISARVQILNVPWKDLCVKDSVYIKSIWTL